MAVDAASSNVYVTGYVSATLDTQTFLGGGSDIVLLKYSTAGVWQWTQLSGSSGDDYGYGGEQRK